MTIEGLFLFTRKLPFPQKLRYGWGYSIILNLNPYKVVPHFHGNDKRIRIEQLKGF